MSVARSKLKKNPHPIAQLRVQFSELEGTARYLRPLTRREEIFPNVLPTAQASLRWSTTSPPLTNFPAELRDGTEGSAGRYIHEPWASGITLPHPGTWWLKFDWDAVEARIEALLSEDQAELDAYAQGFDVHTETACRLFGLPLPPERTKHLHTSTASAGWRAEVGWQGSEDRRRHQAKTVRYALTYSPDERGILESEEFVGQVGRGAALAMARTYLAGRPLLSAMKRRLGDIIARAGEARTGFGHPRRVYRRGASATDDGTRDMRKEGIAHTISGTVSVMGNLSAIRAQAAFPEAYIVRNDHDSQTWAFPVDEQHGQLELLETARPIVEGPWLFPQWPHIPPFTFHASWYTYDDQGGRRKL